MQKCVFIYVNENKNDIIIMNIKTDIQGYKFIYYIRYTDNENADHISSIHIFNEYNITNCNFHIKSGKLCVYNFESNSEAFTFKNDHMTILFNELYDKLIIAQNNNIYI